MKSLKKLVAKSGWLSKLVSATALSFITATTVNAESTDSLDLDNSSIPIQQEEIEPKPLDAEARLMIEQGGEHFVEVLAFTIAAMNICDLHGYRINADIAVSYNIFQNSNFLEFLNGEEWKAWQNARNRFYELRNEHGSTFACQAANRIGVISR